MANAKLLRPVLLVLLSLSIGFAAGQFVAKQQLGKLLMEGPKAIRPLVLNRLRSKLELSDDQVQALEPLLKELYLEGLKIRAEAVPRFLKKLDSTLKRSEDILSEEQLAKVRARINEFQAQLQLELQEQPASGDAQSDGHSS